MRSDQIDNGVKASFVLRIGNDQWLLRSQDDRRHGFLHREFHARFDRRVSRTVKRVNSHYVPIWVKKQDGEKIKVDQRMETFHESMKKISEGRVRSNSTRDL
jgi:hypothetical protein